MDTRALHKAHVFHPWSIQEAVDPIEIVRGKGCYVFDGEGRRYFDFSSQLVCVNAGHGDEAILAGMREQAERICYSSPGMGNDARAQLAAKLAAHAPGDLRKVLFTNGGADGNEHAVKMARLVTGRQKIITRYRSYHGSTFGAMVLGGDPRNHENGPGIPGVHHVLDPFCWRCPFGLEYPACGLHCAEHVRQVIEFEGPENVAAVLMEPITGTNGVIIPPREYLPRIREICDEFGILLILDEVMTGFGRTGRWFAAEHSGVVPDILVCAKGITSGYVPLGAVIVNERVARALDGRALPCGLTYSGHPLACGTGLATLRRYEEGGIFENAAAREPQFAEGLARMYERHPAVGDVRHIGLFGVLDLVKDRGTKEPWVPWNAKGPAGAPAAALMKRLLGEGIFTLVRWSWVFLAPPLVVQEDELADAFERLDRALELADAPRAPPAA